MSNEKMASRPATPSLDLLDVLTEEVFLPTGMAKLAIAGHQPGTREELEDALVIGQQVATAVEARKSALANVTPIQAHAAKVASLIHGAPTDEQIDESINTRIDASSELSQKFAAALMPAQEEPAG